MDVPIKMSQGTLDIYDFYSSKTKSKGTGSSCRVGLSPELKADLDLSIWRVKCKVIA